MDFVLFEQRLIETMIFCHHISAETQGHSVLWNAFNDKSEFLSSLVDEMLRDNDFDWQTTAKIIFDLRKIYVETLPLRANPPIDKTGKIIVYFPDINLFDGASEIESEGYFNFIDCPPSSTWLYYHEGGEALLRHIIAWIPSDYLEKATIGVLVVCCGAIEFLDELDNLTYKTELQDILKRLGNY
jgi:hypothetical protein